jgi:hypothetical protein
MWLELADALDSKSGVLRGVPVRIRPSALIIMKKYNPFIFLFLFFAGFGMGECGKKVYHQFKVQNHE